MVDQCYRPSFEVVDVGVRLNLDSPTVTKELVEDDALVNHHLEYHSSAKSMTLYYFYTEISQTTCKQADILRIRYCLQDVL